MISSQVNHESEASWSPPTAYADRRIWTVVLSFHLIAASELRSYFLAHFDIEDLRGLDLFHNRFAPDPRWNPASLAVDNQFSDELDRQKITNVSIAEAPAVPRIPSW